MRRLPIALMVVGLGLVLRAPSPAQDGGIPVYPVPPVYLPDLERPALDREALRLPEGVSGRLPAFDGERLSLIAPAQGSPEASGELIRAILDGLAFDGRGSEISFRRTVETPAADRELVETEAKRAQAETEAALQQRLGPLSDSTREAVAEEIAEARRLMSRATSVQLFDQRLDGVRFEDSGLRVVTVGQTETVRVTGRVFSQVELENEPGLSEVEAAARAAKHVSQYLPLADKASRAQGELVLVPYGKLFRYAWRVMVESTAGPYEAWIDAASGEVLQLLPRYHAQDGQGRVFDPSPPVGTAVKRFELDAAVGGNFSLVQAGVLDVDTNGADGTCMADVTVPSGGGTFADFDVAPINGTVVTPTTAAGYNCAFQEVNVYAWIEEERSLYAALGSAAWPAITADVNHNNPCGFGTNNACASGTALVQFGLGSRTTGAGVGCVLGSFTTNNSGIDATVISHEFGHLLNNLQYAAAGGNILSQINEGMADFWASTWHNTDTFGAWWGQGCPTVEDGLIPRQLGPQDVFPEHRTLPGVTSPPFPHSDGQMIGWAHWQGREELRAASLLGPLSMSANTIAAMANAGVGVLSGTTDLRVHNAFLDLFQQVAARFDGSRYAHKILSGFARAGLFLSPQEAIIDIDDDYLDRGDATGPSFTVWTGRDYTFVGTAADTTAPPFNTQFVVEVANDAAFTVNLRSIGPLGGVVAGAGGTAGFTLPVADWNAVKAGDFLYYRVTTTPAGGGAGMSSLDPRPGVLATVPAPRAVINDTGRCECGGPTAIAAPWSLLLGFLPFAVALTWRQRIRNRRA